MPRWRPAFLCMLLSACGLAKCAPDPLGPQETATLYARPVPPPEGLLSVYHLGHSLVGRDMPAMLAQLAGAGHGHESQLGWGAELQAHWGDVPLEGGETENDHPRFREAHEAVESGEYDALVMTEKIGLEDSIKYHDSWYYLSLWAEKAVAANPEIRLYLYETWHNLENEQAWLDRLDSDLAKSWEREIIDRALATGRVDRPIYVIPGGQVMARFTRELATRGGVDGLNRAADLFQDDIHFNSAGAYLIALTHYAVLYGRSPVGLPHELLDAKGTPLPPLGAEAARLMQEVVWEVVQAYPRTGVQQQAQ